MPKRFVEVWLEGNSFLPLPRAFPGEPFRLYRNRLRGFFAKYAPSYPDVPNDLLVRAFNDSQFFNRMSYSQPRQFRGFASNAPSVRQAQMSLAQRQRLVQRKQALAGFRVTSFQRSAYSRPGELKGVDVRLTQAAPIVATTSTNGNSTLLNGIAPGTGSWNRVGRRAIMRSLRLRGIVSMQLDHTATSGALIPCTVRMVVVYDKQPSSGTIPTYDSIFGVTAQDGTESSDILDPLRYDNTGRFRVVCDKTFQFNPLTDNQEGGTTDVVIYKKHFDVFKKLPGLEVVFSGQSAPCTLADISTGGLYVYWRSDVSTASTSAVEVSSDSFARLRYTD